jgi:alpha/beta superfamily hydrolase
MTKNHVTFPCGGLSLEGIYHLPEGMGPFPAVVVCHPHPLYGGSMDNNVVYAVCQALCQKGIAALRFNTRGTGRSEGTFDGGIAEAEDVKAAISFAASREQVDPRRIGIAAYSFGAIVSFSSTIPDEVQSVAAISPPLAMTPLDGLKAYNRPKLLVSGGGDNFTSEQAFEGFCQGLSEPKECEVIPGADHFWWGYEEEVGERVASFFASAIGG